MSIAVEIMDSTNGRPAAGVDVVLLSETDGQWHPTESAHTDEAGLTPHLAPKTERGRYRLLLDLDRYFAGFGVTPFQSQVEVVFRVFHSGERVRFLVMITASSCGTHIVLSGDRDDA